MPTIPNYRPANPKTRVYQKLAGVDFTSDDSNVQINRSPNGVNMYKDYRSSLGQAIETRPGFVNLLELDAEIFGIYFINIGALKVLVHSGSNLLLWSNYPSAQEQSTMEVLYTNMALNKSRSFVYNEKMYINDGVNYIYYDGTSIKTVASSAFVPTTTIGRAPTGGGTLYQPVNLLQPLRKNSFLSNGTTTQYTLDTAGLDSSNIFLMTATVNDVTKKEGTDFSVNRTTGIVTFNTAPPNPTTIGQDNVIITLSKTNISYATRISKCLLSCIYDNRVFFSGNNNFPNALFHSMLNDPTYISDLAYYQNGSDNVPITSLLRVGESILVIKLDDQQDAVVYYHTPQIIDEETFYPNKQGLAGIGCISLWGSMNFLDEPVFISRLGLESFTKLNLGLERSIEHKSSIVDGRLVNEPNLSNIHLEQWRGYLMCLINGNIYLADNRQRYQNPGTGQIEYEWYYWDNIGDVDVNNAFQSATLLKEYDEDLLFGTKNGVVAMFTEKIYNDNGRLIYCQWQTPFDDFGISNRVKTTNKKGGLAELKTIPHSVCKLKLKVDRKEEREITRFVASGFSYKNISYIDFTFNTAEQLTMKYKIKAKKWRQISLTFFSDELNRPFGIFSNTLEAFYGGYVKNR